MSNFQELQANKLSWKLNHDESLFEKINYLQDNVVASSHLVHNSIEELNRAISAADTTLNNAINAFGQLNYTKFLENVVEDVSEAEKQAVLDRKIKEEEILEQSLHEIDLNGEKEKIQFALELAIFEVGKKTRRGEEEDNDDPNESRAQSEKKVKAAKPKGHLGTTILMKLPYVIGTPEFAQHAFAGIVYLGTADEQVELHKEEIEKINEDKKNEQLELDKLKKEQEERDKALEKIQEKEVANIPPPPPGDLGNIPPPVGFGAAYVPALVAGGIMPKPQIPIEVPVQQSQPVQQQANQITNVSQQQQAAPAPVPAQTQASEPEADSWRSRIRPSQHQQQTQQAVIPAQTTQAERPDIYQMMYGGAPQATGLFGADALDARDTREVDLKKGTLLFDDEDEDTFAPPKQQVGSSNIKQQQQQQPQKQKGMFDLSSDEDFGAKLKNQGKKPAKDFFGGDSDSDEEKFVPKAKQNQPAKQAAKKQMDSDDSDEPVQKKPPAKKQIMLGSSDDEAPVQKTQTKAPVNAPVAKKQAVILDSDSDDLPPAKTAAQKALPVKAQPAKNKLLEDDDDDDDDFFTSKPTAVKPSVAAKPVAKAPAAAVKKNLFGDSDEDDEDLPPAKAPAQKATPAPAPPSKPLPVGLSKPVKVESDDDFGAPPAKKPEPVKTVPAPVPTPATKPQAQQQDPDSPPRLSIAELAARINPATIGGGDPRKNPNNPLYKKPQPVEEEPAPTATSASVVNADGSFNHAMFSKPQMAKKRAPTKKMTFEASDDDTGDAYYQQQSTYNYDQQYTQQTNYDNYYQQQQYYQPEPVVVQPVQAAPVPVKKAATPAQFNDDDSDELKPPAKPVQAAKPAQAAPVPTKKAATPAQFNDDDSDDFKPPPKAAQAPAQKQAPAAQKKKQKGKFDNSDSDESDSDKSIEFKPPPKASQAPPPKQTATQKKGAFDDSSEDDFSFKPANQTAKAPAAKAKPVIAAKKGGNLFDSDDDDE